MGMTRASGGEYFSFFFSESTFAGSSMIFVLCLHNTHTVSSSQLHEHAFPAVDNHKDMAVGVAPCS